MQYTISITVKDNTKEKQNEAKEQTTLPKIINEYCTACSEHAWYCRCGHKES